MKHLVYSAVAIALLAGCQQRTGSSWEKITFKQDKPALVHLKLGTAAGSHGDGMAFEAAIRDSSGKAVGEVLGWLITVDIMDGDGANPVYITERIGSMVFNLGDENEIVAQGGTSYHQGQAQMKEGLSQKRAVVGGTGIYKGIAGEVTTTRNEDGTYTHVLDVKREK